MPITHTLEFGIYHWDTFDNETILIDEANTLEEAKQKIKDHYGDRLTKDGADQVDIVNSNGDVMRKFSVR
jgi:hypothetical protein